LLLVALPHLLLLVALPQFPSFLVLASVVQGDADDYNKWESCCMQRVPTYWTWSQTSIIFLFGNGLLFHMTQPTSRSTRKAIACSKPTISEH